MTVLRPTAHRSTSVSLLAVRLAVPCAIAVVLCLLMAQPAAAHVEVEADPARAGATEAVLTFTSEAESPTEGFEKVRIVLPAGIEPDGVELVDGPTKWRLTRSADGYSVAGPALAPGEDAVHSVRLRQLPRETSIAFKAVENYSGGKVSRWIDLATPGNPLPEHPAPVLKLAAAATGTPTPAPSPSSNVPGTKPRSVPTTEVAAGAPTTGSSDERQDTSVRGFWGGPAVVLVILVLASIILLLRRRATR